MKFKRNQKHLSRNISIDESINSHDWFIQHAKDIYWRWYEIQLFREVIFHIFQRCVSILNRYRSNDIWKKVSNLVNSRWFRLVSCFRTNISYFSECDHLFRVQSAFSEQVKHVLRFAKEKYHEQTTVQHANIPTFEEEFKRKLAFQTRAKVRIFFFWTFKRS